MDKMKFSVTIDKNRCKGCGLCTNACPKGILKMTGKINKKAYHYPEVINAFECKGCKQCAEICPDAAIEIDGERE